MCTTHRPAHTSAHRETRNSRRDRHRAPVAETHARSEARHSFVPTRTKTTIAQHCSSSPRVERAFAASCLPRLSKPFSTTVTHTLTTSFPPHHPRRRPPDRGPTRTGTERSHRRRGNVAPNHGRFVREHRPKSLFLQKKSQTEDAIHAKQPKSKRPEALSTPFSPAQPQSTRSACPTTPPKRRTGTEFFPRKPSKPLGGQRRRQRPKIHKASMPNNTQHRPKPKKPRVISPLRSQQERDPSRLPPSEPKSMSPSKSPSALHSTLTPSKVDTYPSDQKTYTPFKKHSGKTEIYTVGWWVLVQ